MSKEKRNVILITGGTGAIGSAAVEIAAREGMKVYFTGTCVEKGKKMVADLNEKGLEASFVQNHVQSYQEAKTLKEQIKEECGRLDCLVNNVGYNVPQEERDIFCRYKEEAWDRVTQICLDGLYHMTAVFLDMLKESDNASVINIGSVTGMYMGLRNQCAYNVCKALIHNITRGMAIEYGKYGIRVNAVIPGSTMNPMLAELLYADKGSAEKMLKHVPLETVGDPADIGEMIVHLAKKKSKYVNGCLINIDGGWAAGYSAGK